MRTVVFYRSMSEHGRAVEDFMREYTRRTNRELETMDPDTREGDMMGKTYDVVEYPTILALREDGTELARWRGPLPTIDEVSSYND
jgi:hypothetical protein